MKLRKIISGGQTGADWAGLFYAKKLGLETGGTAPKGWRTDEGTNPNLANYGLVESESSNYKPRTEANVRDSDATAWFGNPSPGKTCTENACTKYQKPFFVITNPKQFLKLAETFEVINVAGNRARLNPEVSDKVWEAFTELMET